MSPSSPAIDPSHVDDSALSPLTAVSPLDGRYAGRTRLLRSFVSEYALLRYRTLIELRWLQKLASEADIDTPAPAGEGAMGFLEDIIDNFSLADAERIKTIEKTTNHDVKAVEYFLRERLSKAVAIAPELDAQDSKWLNDAKEMLHFACTSEDINNLSFASMLADARQEALLPSMRRLLQDLREFARTYAGSAMLSRTHGQPASPTTLGKEMAVFAHRLESPLDRFAKSPIRGKFNGAVGNYNAHLAAWPDIDWPRISREFVAGLGLEWNSHTTQIEPHDFIAELFHALIRFNLVILDLCRDMWSYISLGYFRQRPVQGEVGSSTMPHKINPIDFENAEGNLGIANALLGHLAEKLPISRLQRDLSDSTALRNIGVALGHSLIAYESCLKGLSRAEVDEDALAGDLEGQVDVLAEAIQTVMRRHGIENSYEKLKSLTRGRHIDRKALEAFIEDLPIPQGDKDALLRLRPRLYIGAAKELALDIGLGGGTEALTGDATESVPESVIDAKNEL
ncbi:MAG: adenylosuccinate lyase [Ectothiorhodospiraceae bacterium AqS1]|nr:adenylosuccinate lyase [Ectothiorhodospiraceae bacterium AqS1]MBF2761024.1 adenylosuccinate lyase [Ectothiorhodospiraceae bacterium AqS1]